MRKAMIRALTASFAIILVLAACGLEQDDGETDEGGAFQPSDVEFLVHTGPGGGSDIFVRDVIAMMREEGLIEENWPVRNEEAGEGAGAMAYLLGKGGSSSNISAMTTTWITTPLTIEGADVTVDDLTPIAGLIIEPEVMAVPGDSPYGSLTDFVEDAQQNPGDLVQAGGSTTEVGALNGKTIATDAGTSWKFLSFEEVGQRVAAMLNDDAQMMFGSAQDFQAQIDAGKLKVVATISPEPSPIYPDAPTVQEEGFDVELVAQVRGVMGPPDMPPEALEYYQNLFGDLVESDSWKEYAEKNGIVTRFMIGDEWESYLAEQQEVVREKLEEIGELREDV
jgi:putative tricarboxylic transport membrane protein